MKQEYIIIFAISAALIAVLTIVAYNKYDVDLRTAAYKECIKTNKEIANLENQENRFYLPTCYMK